MKTNEVVSARAARIIADRISERAERVGYLRGLMEAARFLRMTGDRIAADRLIGRALA